MFSFLYKSKSLSLSIYILYIYVNWNKFIPPLWKEIINSRLETFPAEAFQSLQNVELIKIEKRQSLEVHTKSSPSSRVWKNDGWMFFLNRRHFMLMRPLLLFVPVTVHCTGSIQYMGKFFCISSLLCLLFSSCWYAPVAVICSSILRHSFLLFSFFNPCVRVLTRLFLKGTEFRNRIQPFGQKLKVLVINKNLFWFCECSKCFNDEMSSLPFPVRFRWKHIGELTYIWDIFTDIS